LATDQEQPSPSNAGEASASIEIYRSAIAGGRLSQGEIIQDLIEWTPSYAANAEDTVDGVAPIVHQFAVVLTQDCDLEQDWKGSEVAKRKDRDLLNILICPANNAESLRQKQSINSERWTPIRNNKNERYQYLADVPATADVSRAGIPALLLDFRRVFAVRAFEAYRQILGTDDSAAKRRTVLKTPWAEHLQLRFCMYQARIGLPLDHFVPEKRR
jgi:hypothetical protein